MITTFTKSLAKLFAHTEQIKLKTAPKISPAEISTVGLWVKLPSPHVVCFLDLNRVLHACQNESLERMPLLEILLDECPSMYIVITSSWRESASISYLKSLFSASYRDRVIGATGSLYISQDKMGVRAAECEDFAFTHRVKSFICLDDGCSLYPAGYPHLYRTDYATGLKESDIPLITARYQSLMSRWGNLEGI